MREEEEEKKKKIFFSFFSRFSFLSLTHSFFFCGIQELQHYNLVAMDPSPLKVNYISNFGLSTSIHKIVSMSSSEEATTNMNFLLQRCVITQSSGKSSLLQFG